MRKLTFSEWVAVAVAVVIIAYFFQGTMFTFSSGTPSVASVSSGIIEDRDTIAPSTTTAIMTNNTYSLPGIEVTDVVVGTGEEAVVGKTVVVNYTGAFTNGQVFDSSIPRGVPFDFVLGAGGVIKGWDEGVAGMKVGGKRILVIDPSKGYGPNDYGPIPGNSTLVFEVELLDVQ